MTKQEAQSMVARAKVELAEAKENFNYWFALVDDMESNDEACDYEKEELGYAEEELDFAKDRLENAEDLLENWCH